MLNSKEVEDIENEIAELRAKLQDKEDRLKNKKYGSLRAALESRKEIDKRIVEELKQLGYGVYYYNWKL